MSDYASLIRPTGLLPQTQRGLNEHYVVAMMTSHLRGLSFVSDVVLQEWKNIGLPKPTLVRLAKVVTIDRRLIRRKIGRLRASYQKAGKESFRALFSSF